MHTNFYVDAFVGCIRVDPYRPSVAVPIGVFNDLTIMLNDDLRNYI